jgi:riboflavin biosynthesis pyrimidine reductase
VDANPRLGLPADSRRYDDAVAVLQAVGVRSVRLATNNPGKADGLRAGGLIIEQVVPAPTTPSLRNRRAEQRLAGRHIAIRHVPQGPGGLDIRAALRQLYAEGIRSVVVEGGPRIIASLPAASLVDHVVVAISPQLHGPGAVAPGGLSGPVSTRPLPLMERSGHLVGDQVIIAGRLAQRRA